MNRDYYRKNRKNRNFGLWLGGSLLVAYLFIVFTNWDTVYADFGLGLSSILVEIAAVGSFICASYCWAKYKNRSGWFALRGLLAPLGFIALVLLKDEGESS